MPCVVDSNFDVFYTMEDSSSEMSDEVCGFSDVKISQVQEEVREEEDLGIEIGEESDWYTTSGKNFMETQAQESTSTIVFKDGERCESYGGARDFFLDGAQEYIACGEFFSLCYSI